MSEASVRRAFLEQAQWCETLGSPFTSLLCTALGERLDRRTRVGRAVLDWPGETPNATGDVLPLRLAGGLHALVRRGLVPALRALYPPNAMPAPEQLWQALADALAQHEKALLPWLANAPQTNEVARAGPLFAGLLTIADRTRLPLALFEIGASAGLNLNLDRFGYRFAKASRGDPASALVLSPAWQGPPPPAAAVRIIRRAGNDIAPIDASSSQGREKLIAYVWADQFERIARLEAALAIANTHRPLVEAGDAADFVDRHFGAPPVAGEARVLMHSIAFQYLPAASQARAAQRMQDAGGAATADAPVAWLRFEVDPAIGAVALRLTLWPDGREQVLATGDPHGRGVRWLA